MSIEGKKSLNDIISFIEAEYLLSSNDYSVNSFKRLVLYPFIKNNPKGPDGNPIEGQTYKDRAEVGPQNTDYFCEDDALAIAYSAEVADYFINREISRESLLRILQVQNSINRAEKNRKDLLAEPTLEDSKASYQEYENKRFEEMFEEGYAQDQAAFEIKFGRLPENDDELYAADLSGIYFGEPDPEFPDPISDEKLNELRMNFNLSPVYGFTEEGIPIITDYKERSYDDADVALSAYIDRFSNEALYNLFFEPINPEELRADLYRYLDEYRWHHDTVYYEIEDKLSDFRNYCKKKEDPYGLRALISDMQLSDDQLDSISDVVSDKVLHTITEAITEKISCLVSDAVKVAFDSQKETLKDIRRDINKDVELQLTLLRHDLGVLKKK